mgnify:CR=1 FL=1
MDNRLRNGNCIYKVNFVSYIMGNYTNMNTDAANDWWFGGVIYQIYPRSFYDSNNDGVGDLRGVMSKLPYLKALGVDGIWLSPFFKSPMKDFGYDISDYEEIDLLFGTMEDFEALLKAAHDLDIKLVIDQVYSHTSDQHEWFKESRRSKDNPKLTLQAKIYTTI